MTLPIRESSEKTFNVTVYVAGDYAAARATLRAECLDEGLCVTVTPTTFVFTGGAEDGVAVGFVNYPRFPKPGREIWDRAVRVGHRLMADLCQWSALVVGPLETRWLNRRPEDAP